MDELISADQARKNAEDFDMTTDQVLERIARSISVASCRGKRSVVSSFLTSAVTEQELAQALQPLRDKGYNVEQRNHAQNGGGVFVTISW